MKSATYIEQVATSVSSTTLAALNTAAEREAISRAAWIRRAIERALKVEANNGRS